jgi:hypothetical protein
VNPENIPYRYWIYFKDKGEFLPDDKIENDSKAYKEAVSQLSPKALWRRKKVLKDESLVRYEDIPVNKDYLIELRKKGYKINSVSKWFNAVTVLVKKDDLKNILKLPFVLKAEGVRTLIFPEVETDKSIQKSVFLQQQGNYKYNYGPSFWQYEQIKVPALHNYGVTGLGVTVGMCDDGFNWRNQISLRDRKVIDEFDWIKRDDSTQYQAPEDDWDQDGHGTATMSCLGGFFETQIVGPAFDAEFYLSKTEDNSSETPVEEDYWLEAVEWMEAMGAEVISSSLIYKPFDDPNDDYTYKDMNGKTTVIARAGNMAAYLGIVVLNSMGNERQTNPPSIVSPPDADSVIAVGAVDSAGTIAYFSSNGPTSDGRMKPDVVAMGEYVWAATSKTVSLDDSTFSHTSGTSFSCPITAGVCAQILSVHPYLTPMQVREALKKTADKSNNPNNVYGWGLINALEAALYHGSFLSSTPEIKITKDEIIISTYLLTKNLNAGNVQLFISQDGSENFETYEMNVENPAGSNVSGKYSIKINRNSGNIFLKFYFKANDSVKEITAPYNAPGNFFIYRDPAKGLEVINNY